MKACIEKSIAILMFVCFLSTSTMVFSEESKWLFNSIYGQRLWISYDSKESLYTLTLGDVTEKVTSCESALMKVCFRSNFVDIAIPRKEPKVGERWGDTGTTFSLVSVIEDLELLDKSYRDILVISVNKNKLGGSGMRQFKLFYSYNHGLIAFQEESDQGREPIIIASNLPSLGR